MTHYKLNRIILGVAALYSVVIIAAAFFGPTSQDDETELVEYTPGYVDTASETPTPHTGVGGVSNDDSAIAGTILDAGTGEPMAGVSVTAEDADADEVITTTGADGRFELRDISEPVTVTFSLNGYGTVEEVLDPADDHIVEMEPPFLAGRVINANGSPIRGATIASGDVFTRSVESGEFRLEDVPADEDLIVKAAGHKTQIVPQDEFESGFTMEPVATRAIYAPASTIADDEQFNELLDLIERTDLNALVIDLKDNVGRVYYESAVEMATEIGAVEPSYDVESVLQELDDRGISAIARINVFEDPRLAEARPDLAIQDTFSDDLWRTWQGRAWANPYQSEVWDYNVALVQEAAALGFAEVQLAAVQFPEGGLISRADYGQTSTGTRRQAALADFLEQAYASIASTESLLGAEIFAMSLWDESNQMTGQDLGMMTQRVDYIHPLLFPSHFEAGSLGLDSPGDHPSAIVGRSLESGLDLLPRHLSARIRPWLQDFSYGSAMPIGEDEVQEQIQSASNFASSGWMLWNPDGDYHAGALDQVE